MDQGEGSANTNIRTKGKYQLSSRMKSFSVDSPDNPDLADKGSSRESGHQEEPKDANYEAPKSNRTQIAGNAIYGDNINNDRINRGMRSFLFH